eukprot:1116900-Pyramimonas_sp.AAC.1
MRCGVSSTQGPAIRRCVCVFPQADREALEHVLHAVMPLVNVTFFTLIGASLNLGIIAKTLHIAICIVLVRGGPQQLTAPRPVKLTTRDEHVRDMLRTCDQHVLNMGQTCYEHVTNMC